MLTDPPESSQPLSPDDDPPPDYLETIRINLATLDAHLYNLNVYVNAISATLVKCRSAIELCPDVEGWVAHNHLKPDTSISAID